MKKTAEENDTADMTEDIITRLFERCGLGMAVRPITPVSGGFMHRMYRVDTAEGSFAVKHLNPGIMRRPEAMENYSRAEALETVLERHGIPIVPALAIDGRKMQSAEGAYFYIFRWQNGSMTDWNNITPEQCRMAGNIQGRIHAIDCGHIELSGPEQSSIDWRGFAERAFAQNSEIAPLLKENEPMLVYAQDELNRARAALPRTACITDEDMDPKNVMWDGGRPVVIDLENLEYGSPVSSALQLSLQWAGITTCGLDLDKVKAFFDGYLEACDSGFRDYAAVFGLAYTWLEWLEYNIRRALGECSDEAERGMGVSEVRNTLARIRYLRDNEDDIKRHFGLWFG